MPVSYRIRAAVASDGAFLADMAVEAANWRPQAPRPRPQVLAATEHGRYVAGWMRPGDAGFVAEDDAGTPIGAAWYRVFPRTDPGFGYVGTAVPELIIGVRPIWRAHGVGRALVQRICAHAREAGHARLSLSVERGNFAANLYRDEGFALVQAEGGRDTMVKRLR
ncbi:GNAT family N-acetyltransferase [Microbacterium sp.]|uniref:GNAT family N-acetyltransferase n=1 Tax=Microbacterium sp. TaxID=51671 RepID=UPI0039E55A70